RSAGGPPPEGRSRGPRSSSRRRRPSTRIGSAGGYDDVREWRVGHLAPVERLRRERRVRRTAPRRILLGRPRRRRFRPGVDRGGLPRSAGHVLGETVLFRLLDPVWSEGSIYGPGGAVRRRRQISRRMGEPLHGGESWSRDQARSSDGRRSWLSGLTSSST